MSNSDYNKKRHNLFDLLPEVLQSDTNRSVLENSINRLLTKIETKHTDGYAGVGNPKAIISLRINEPSPDRQAYQLQPILYTKIGSVEHMATYKDILNKLERLGVDIDRLPEWGKALRFNYAPPVDFDKILNYRDYYWYDVADTTSKPQYITIKNLATVADSRIFLYNRVLESNGTKHNAVQLDSIDNVISIISDLSAVLVKDFVFFTTSSSNLDFKATWWKVESSSYDPITNITDIYVDRSFSDENNTDVVVSLTEYLLVLESERDCILHGEFGYGTGLWDDNQIGSVIWNTDLIVDISHETEAGFITTRVDEIPLIFDIWYDTSTDQLKQLTTIGTPNVWVVVQNSFSVLLEQTTGENGFGTNAGCPLKQQIQNEWILQNKWLHRSVVPNFSNTRQAQIPIIEYIQDLEINEWTFTDFKWKYRVSAAYPFASTSNNPLRIELDPLAAILGVGATELVFDGNLGDMTATFIEDYIFTITEGSVNENVTVLWATFSDRGKDLYQTVVKLSNPISNTILALSAAITATPIVSSNGHPWSGYHQHWLFDGASDVVPVNAQPLNPFLDVSTSEEISTVDVRYRLSKYAQEFLILAPFGLSVFNFDATITSIIRANSAGTRVYINDIRQFGNYEELTNNGFVIGIDFGTNPIPQSAVVRIEVGVSTISDVGFESVAVRTEEADSAWDTNPIPVFVDLVSYRKTEQLKVEINQYPLFDMYNIDNTSAHRVSNIFGFREDSNLPVNFSIGKRIVRIQNGREYEFEQNLIDSDDGPMRTYRDVSNNLDVWNDTDSTYHWDGKAWDPRVLIDGHYIKPAISIDQPTAPFNEINGFVWTNPVNEITSTRVDFEIETPNYLERKIIISSLLGNVTESFAVGKQFYFDKINSVFTIESITYDDINTIIVTKETISSVNADYIIRWISIPSLTNRTDPYLQTIWRKGLNNEEYVPSYVNGDREVVPIGDDTGDWELSDQLYYNNSHENRKIISLSSLIPHFGSIIEQQVILPGFGSVAKQTTFLQYKMNVGVGGSIREYAGSYDTFLSALYTDIVSPLGIIDFGQKQYDISISLLKTIFTNNVVDYMTNTDQQSVVDLNSTIANIVISSYERNDSTTLLFGDSSSYNEQTGLGIRNWIITLPMMRLTDKCYPSHSFDPVRKINEVLHHDGHRSQYFILPALKEIIIQDILDTTDPRSDTKLGIRSKVQPPMTIPDFLSEFSTNELLNGVYWYTATNSSKILHRFVVSSIADLQPESPVDGELWVDTSSMLLKQYILNTFEPVTGIVNDITSAWTTLDLDDILGEVILEVERRLYDVSPENGKLVYDFDSLDQDLYSKYYEEAFSDYVHIRGIESPFNTIGTFEPSKPFTWNYKYSTITQYPSSLNTGDETGGIWQDLYEKIYGTPYPHLEPWILQGYCGKPIWWDTEYLNNDTAKYSDRRWKYSHGLIIDVDATARIFYITGDFVDELSVLSSIDIVESPEAHNNNYPIISVTFDSVTNRTAINTSTYILDFGISGRITNLGGMWENIRIGTIPLGRIAPDGVTIGTGLPTPNLPTYAFFSVNIGDRTLGGIRSDELFPPYWDHRDPDLCGSIYSGSIRSLFFDLSVHVFNTSLDFIFEDAGDIEWQWLVSSQNKYDRLKIAFRIDPIYFIESTFGLDLVKIAELGVDYQSKVVYSHASALFHGDIIDDSVFTAVGLNQWYVNFNRYAGFDISSSNFRKLWRNWKTPIGYQFSTFVDNSTFLVTNKNFDISSHDFDITLKRSPGISDHWLDALNVTIQHVPPQRLQYNTQGEWKFGITTKAPIGRRISYFGVENYKFNIDTDINIATLYKFNIKEIDPGHNLFIVDGDQQEAFSNNAVFIVSLNNTEYVSTSASFDLSTNTTIIKVSTQVPLPETDGTIIVSHRTIPWDTGDMVRITANKLLPIPLIERLTYYIIKHSDIDFELAETYENAISGIAIPFQSAGKGDVFVGRAISEFDVELATGELTSWKHYAIDKNFVSEFLPPKSLTGVQNLINLIDGYSAYTDAQGFRINVDAIKKDPVDNSTINWYNETDRFLFWIHNVQASNFSARDSYTISANQLDDTFTFSEQTATWPTGKKVILISSLDVPVPFLSRIPYYIIRDVQNPKVFQLAATAIAANNGIAISVLSDGDGQLSIQNHVEIDQSPSFELNPFRTGVWFNHPQGIISNIIKGPYADIRSEQTLYDQYGRLLENKNINILREDKQTQIRVHDEIKNDVASVNYTGIDPYNYLHLGGVHLFLDGYEHVILFNDYTSDGFLIYDSYIGLNTAKFSMQFDGQPEFTLRPNVGGYFLNNNKLIRNMESNIEDLRQAYDTFTTAEANIMTQKVRDAIGYDGPKEFLEQLNINPKSQFIFWRGIIQSKGSTNSIKAFINSRRFIDARIDEYWAYKIGDFGAAISPEYPQMNLFADDSLKSELKIEFLSVGDSVTPGFEGVTIESLDRWFEFPNQRKILESLGPMYFDSTITLDDSPVLEMINGIFYYISDIPFDRVKLFDADTELSSGQYTIINSSIIRFVGDIFSTLKIYKLNADKVTSSTAKIIDHKQGSVTSDIPVWDPARNHHYHQAIHLVDLVRDTDPSTEKWISPEVGTSWFDTSTVEYVPYYDLLAFPLLEDRIKKWGKLSEWSTIVIYQWTESTIPPEEWDEIAAVEEADASIPESIRKSGKAKRRLMKHNGSEFEEVKIEHIRTHGVFIPASRVIDVSVLKVAGPDLGNDLPADLIAIFINGAFAELLLVSASITVTITATINSHDVVDIVRTKPTDEQLDAGDYIYEHPFNSVITKAADGSDITTYYFWVGEKKVRQENQTLSLDEAARQLVDIPIPYMITQSLNTDNHYSQLIIRGLSGTIKEDDRYLLRFTRDFTLRDELGRSDLELKNVHTEWAMFRRHQQYHVPRALWNKATESMIGELLSDSTIRVPSLDRELYDEVHQTDTRYGLGEGQTFVNRETAIATVLFDLRNPDNSFSPLNINRFFEQNDFDTPESIKKSMKVIYSSFASGHVNRIFFLLLHDAFSVKTKYSNIIKTSMVSLHGVKLLEEENTLDD